MKPQKARGHRKLSEAIRGHQTQSDAISMPRALCFAFLRVLFVFWAGPQGLCFVFLCFGRASGGPAGPVFCVFVFWAGTTGLCFVFSCFGRPPSKHSTGSSLSLRGRRVEPHSGRDPKGPPLAQPPAAKEPDLRWIDGPYCEGWISERRLIRSDRPPEDRRPIEGLTSKPRPNSEPAHSCFFLFSFLFFRDVPLGTNGKVYLFALSHPWHTACARSLAHRPPQPHARNL
jgi:hypothetical protein